jgi:hypothetical protein
LEGTKPGADSKEDHMRKEVNQIIGSSSQSWKVY